nr:integrase, catalytic region, zinc finger, CCHC-type, peptidase aspartic, catalytic [Tanacetum cinerariifolium]
MESSSPKLDLFSGIEEHSEEETTKIMTETMKQYMSKTRGNYWSGVVRPKIIDKTHFELKGQFLKELRENTFSGLEHEDSKKHFEKVPEIVDLFHIPEVTQDQVMLRTFPMSLTRDTSRWLRKEPSDLDTLSSVRRPKPSGVIWMKKGSSNTVKADLSSVNNSNLNKNVKRYSRKNLMACNNSDTRSAFDCNNARNALCNARMNVSVDVNDFFFVFDDICLWIIDSGCSMHMTGNRALLTNFVEKFFGTVRFGNNDFAVIAGYGDVVIGSMTIKKV